MTFWNAWKLWRHQRARSLKQAHPAIHIEPQVTLWLLAGLAAKGVFDFLLNKLLGRLWDRFFGKRGHP
jgi:hypothetical protein